MTAAGRVPPCRVLVIGGGVAGLAAAAQARCMGAAVRAFDTRPAVREQIESLGAQFITMEMKVRVIPFSAYFVDYPLFIRLILSDFSYLLYGLQGFLVISTVSCVFYKNINFSVFTKYFIDIYNDTH